MKVALITSYPPSKVTLNEYGYYLSKHFVTNPKVEEFILLTDYTEEPKLIDYKADSKLVVDECWKFNSWFNLFSILRAVRKHKPDVVIINAHFLSFGDSKIPATLGLMLPLLFKFMGQKNIFLIHNILEKVDLNKAGFTSNNLLIKAYNFIGSIITRLFLQADVVAVTIEQYVKILEEKYKVKHVKLIPHGSFETPPPPDFQLPDGPLQIMTFGKFGTYKKVEIMIEAVEMLRKEMDIPMEIVVAGTDNPNVKGYLEEVQQKYAHVSDMTFTGYVPEEDVERIFRESAVVIFPYTSTTGSSGVLHQAGSYGKAVVLPKIDDLDYLIEKEGYRGEYFEPNDVRGLADAIKKIIENESYRNELGMINYNAAKSIPMEEVVNMYISEAERISKK